MGSTIGGNGIRVLVVDDETSICQALDRAFSRRGYDIQTVQSGKLAEDLLRTEHFDCMIVDFLLKDTRGDILFHVACALQPHLARRTIFTTGDFSDRAESLIEACHCQRMDKPFELLDLIAMVRQLTQRVQDASA
jgi:two-component system NtrC family sensor kinase